MDVNKKLSFYIWSPHYEPSSGGPVVLHRLNHVLTSLGEDSTIVCPYRKNEEWLGKRIDMFSATVPINNNIVAIYPEVIDNNPFKSPIVVRWILNTTGVCGGNGLYQQGDIIYKYANDYSIPDESMNRGLLTLFNIDDTRKFTNKQKHLPGTVCHLVRKGAYKNQIHHSDHSLCIDDYGTKGGHDYLRKVFDQYETFISYDHATFISVQAALSGCISIIVPQEGLSKEEWAKKDLYHGYGRSYGFDDIEWAKSTQEQLRNKLEELEELSILQVKDMVAACYNKFNSNEHLI
jgi:hypothetical protein